MRGLLKRDDPTVQGSVSSKYQLLLGSCLTAHASRASPSLGELPLRMHVRNETIPTSTCRCGASACVEAFIRCGCKHHSPPFLSQPRASSAAPACILLMLP